MFESGQVWCWLMEIWMLSGVYVVNFWVYCELVFVFYNKHHNVKYILRHEGQYFQIFEHYSNPFSYTLYPLEKSWDKCSFLNSTNYNRLIQIIIHFVHKHQIKLLTLSDIETFLSFATQAVFYTLPSAGGSNVHKTLCTDVKSFH
jgi:hypothetical protein